MFTELSARLPSYRLMWINGRFAKSGLTANVFKINLRNPSGALQELQEIGQNVEVTNLRLARKQDYWAIS